MATADFCVGVRPDKSNFMPSTPYVTTEQALLYSQFYTRVADRVAVSRFPDLAKCATSDVNAPTLLNIRSKPVLQDVPYYPTICGPLEDYRPHGDVTALRPVPREICEKHDSYQRFGKTYCTGKHELVKQTSADSPSVNGRNGEHFSSNTGTWLDARALFLDPILKLSHEFKIRELSGPGLADALLCSNTIEYPAASGKHKYVLHTVVPELVHPLLVLNALRNSGCVRGRVQRTALETTFLVEECDPGHFEIDLKGGKCAAHLVLHEPRHEGHMGCFAAGYSYFLCGFQSRTVSRVVIRADTRNTHVVISRSYSADCESLGQQPNGRKSASKSEVKASQVSAVDECAVVACCEWEQMLHQEESNLLKEFLYRDKVEHSSERSQSPPLIGYPAAHQHVPQLEEPKMSKRDLLHALGVFTKDPKKQSELNMKTFPCELCKSALFKEMRSLIQSTSASPKGSDHSATAAQNVHKYFAQRFRLVSRFNQSLGLSDVAWFSICPEEISKHIGRRIAVLSRKLGRKIRIMDPFCGAGGNIVQAARMDEVSQAYASDIELREVECAQRMTELYGVREKFSFAVSDFFDLKSQMFDTIDAIVCSPPWGGPSYLCGVYDLTQMAPNYSDILAHCATFTKNMAFLLPRNVCIDQLVDAAGAADSSAAVELEINFLAGKPKTSTVYYGDLVNK